MITLTTDFGLKDGFVGTIRGVILRINPKIRIVDISHDIKRHDIHSAAYIINASYRYFPSNSIHMVVVDPGVGSTRKVLIVASGDHLFVVPDNGVMKYIFHKDDSVKVIEVTNTQYFLSVIFATFHGRDIFAPVAAHLSLGVKPHSFGPTCDDYYRGEINQPELTPDLITGYIEYIDRFGNLITNIPNDSIADTMFVLEIGNYKLTTLSNSYAEGKEHQLMLIRGNAGTLELAFNKDDAHQLLNLDIGDKIIIRMFH